MPVTRLAICFEPAAPATALRQCLAMLGFTGPDPRWRWHTPGLLTVVLDQPPPAEVGLRIARIGGVRRVVDRTASAAAAPRWRVPLGKTAVGGGGLCVIAGPCSVEGRSQITEIAAVVAEHGGDALRGGAWKPRTSPWSFGGLGEPGLELLAAAGARFGLPVVSEVLDADDLDVVARYADVLQIGARNMQNYPLLFRAGSHPLGRPVLLKRGPAATLEETRQAAEYVALGRLSAGSDEPLLLLCERGVRTFEPEVRYGFDVAAIPLLQQSTGLPVIADPSHAAGRVDCVGPLARAAVAAGADGLLIEVHTDPRAAWSDGPQTLGPAEFARVMREVRTIATTLGGAPTTSPPGPAAPIARCP